jgi:hypothetical protein
MPVSMANHPVPPVRGMVSTLRMVRTGMKRGRAVLLLQALISGNIVSSLLEDRNPVCT